MDLLVTYILVLIICNIIAVKKNVLDISKNIQELHKKKLSYVMKLSIFKYFKNNYT